MGIGIRSAPGNRGSTGTSPSRSQNQMEATFLHIPVRKKTNSYSISLDYREAGLEMKFMARSLVDYARNQAVNGHGLPVRSLTTSDGAMANPTTGLAIQVMKRHASTSSSIRPVVANTATGEILRNQVSAIQNLKT